MALGVAGPTAALGGGGLSAALGATPTGLVPAEEMRGQSPLEVARRFEAILVAQVISAMRRTIGESGLLSASPERRVLDGLFDQQLAESLLARIDLGLARPLADEMGRRAAAGRTDPGGGDGELRDRAAAGSAQPGHAQGDDATDGRGATLPGPVAGDVTSGFGLRADPFTGEPRFHAGVDVAAPLGATVRAVAAGEVVFSGRRGPSGNLVAVRHDDGSVMRYAHLDEARVGLGARVRAGDVLATVGETGRATGPHLHLALERDGELVDPAALLERVGVTGRATRDYANAARQVTDAAGGIKDSPPSAEKRLTKGI